MVKNLSIIFLCFLVCGCSRGKYVYFSQGMIDYSQYNTLKINGKCIDFIYISTDAAWNAPIFKSSIIQEYCYNDLTVLYKDYRLIVDQDRNLRN